MNNFWLEENCVVEIDEDIVKEMNAAWLSLVEDKGQKPNIIGFFTDLQIEELDFGEDA